MTENSLPDLVVLSHLRWTWVWQRPQHLVSRFAALREAAGATTWFVEEPVFADVDAPVLKTEHRDGIVRAWLEVPSRANQPAHIGFDAREAGPYVTLLRAALAELGSPERDVLVYTPLALDLARELDPQQLSYDIMDDLASFKNASPGLKLAQRRLLAAADVIFAGGRSLHESAQAQSSKECHLFPSGVDTSHYEASRSLRDARAGSGRKVAGYVGVIDERVDLELIAGLAQALPDWTIRIVGPTAKIDPDDRPREANIEYPGMASYDDLPQVMAEFDVALMPFALNEATRSISPTKTLEYLAAGLPVVSTRVADVVADYTGVVHFADTALDFAHACTIVVGHSLAERDALLAPLQHSRDWNTIASSMADLMDAPRATSPSATPPLPSGFARELELAHRQAAGAASAGLQDSALGALRLSGSAVTELADAAVTSATPFLRAPLLARASAALLLHPVAGDTDGLCPTCRATAPCATAQALVG